MRWLWAQAGRWTVVTPCLRERALGIGLVVFTAIYLGFSFFEIPLWGCAWREWTGSRCPGCGLTTGCKAFLRGHFSEGIAWNWFAPIVVGGMVATPVYLALPRTVKESTLVVLERWERQTRFVLWLILLMVAQVAARLMGWA